MILTIDVGTTSLKAGVFNQNAELLHFSKKSVPLVLTSSKNCTAGTTGTTGKKIVEIAPSSWHEALKKALSSFTQEVRRGISSVIISGNGPTIIPVSKTGIPVANARTWLDKRGIKEAESILMKKDIRVDASFFLSKAYAFSSENEKGYEKTAYFLPCPEYFNFLLTGMARTILPAGGFKKYYWNEEALSALNLDKSKFPPFIFPGQVLGQITPGASGEYGLPPGTEVITGGPDFIMSLLGTGTVTEGATCDRAGTSEGLNHCSSKVIDDKRLLCMPHPARGYYNYSNLIATTGKALEWFRECFPAQSPVDLYKSIDLSPPGANRLIFLPYLSGKRSPSPDPGASGVFYGLTLKTTYNDMARSVAESIGYSMREIVEILEENHLYINEIRVAGGLSANRVLNRIKANITGKRILRPKIAESELLGCCLTALISKGIFKTLLEAADTCIKFFPPVEPEKQYRDLYQEQYNLFKKIYLALKETY
jgi:xylulokinase